MRETFDLFDFELAPDDLSRIDGLDQGAAGRRGANPDTFDWIPD
jgi:2,5-diketo-D-gluconate reductase A